MATQKLTEYELRRLENIKRNDEMLAALKVRSKVSAVFSAVKRPIAQKKSNKGSPRKKLKTEAPVVLRRSLRARGVPPDSSGLGDDFNNSLTLPKISKSVSSSPVTPREKGPIKMRDVYSEYLWNGKLVETILDVSKKRQLGSVVLKGEIKERVKEEAASVSCNSVLGAPKSGNFDYPKVKVEDMKPIETILGASKKSRPDCVGYLKDETDARISTLAMPKNENFDFPEIKWRVHGSIHVEELKLELENIARILSGRIMSLRFFPTVDMRMVVVGNKFGNIGFWNFDTEEEDGGGIYVFHPHSAPVSGICIQPFSMSKMITSSYDGFIRLMDVEKELFDLLYDSDDAIFSISQRPSDVWSSYFGEGYGTLGIWDGRASKSSASWHLHEDRINSIDFNPKNENIMATSSTDGTACIWDIRCMDADKTKSLLTVSHERAVYSAYFSPSGRCLATTSIDDKVCLVTGANYEDISMIYHYNQTGRWLSKFRATWGWDDTHLFIGNMKRAVDVISSPEKRIIATLESEHMSAIPCCFDPHPCKLGMLAAATSGGQVYIWT